MMKIFISVVTTLIVVTVGWLGFMSVPEHTEYYVKNPDGTKVQIAVVSRNKFNGEKNLYLSNTGKVYKNENETSIYWSVNLTADYLYGRDVKVEHKTHQLQKVQLERTSYE